MRDPSFWSDVVTRVLSTYAVVIFVMWWSGFIVAMVVNLEWLDLVWYWVRGLPLVAQIIVWVLFLPLHVGFATLRPNSSYRANFRYALLVRRNPPLFHRYRRR